MCGLLLGEEGFKKVVGCDDRGVLAGSLNWYRAKMSIGRVTGRTKYLALFAGFIWPEMQDFLDHSVGK